MINFDGSRPRRFTRAHPCPICGSYDMATRGAGMRCYGFASSDGRYAHCTREELAGALAPEANGTYAHRLDGPCRCGALHNTAIATAPVPAPAPTAVPRIVATYEYQAADGTLLYQVVRLAPKSFRQRRPDGSGGWVWTTAGVAQVLYRLPELLARPAERVYLVEGEKDAEALIAAGALATTAAMGASAAWQPAYTEALRGRAVVVVVDADRAGRARGERVGRALAGVAASLRVVDLAPARTNGYDVSDWLAEGHTRAELEAIAASAPDLCAPAPTAPRALPRTITAAELLAMEFPEPRWAVPGIVPEGLTLLVGAPKTGKSWLMLDVIAGVASGARVLGYADCAAGDSLYLALEDGDRRLQRRLRKQVVDQGGMRQLHIATSWRRFDDGGQEDLAAWLDAHPACRLVVIDTLARIRPRERPGGGVYRQDYEALAPLADLARAHGVAIVVVHHTRKMASEDVLDLVSGSNGLAGSVDAILVLQRQRLGDEAVLTLTGRDVEEQALACAFDHETCRWTIQGEASAVLLSQLQQEILEALAEEEAALRAADIADRLGRQNDSSLRHTLCKMVRDGLIMRTVRGLYAVAQRATATFGNAVGQRVADVIGCDHVIGGDPPDPGAPSAPPDEGDGSVDGARAAITPITSFTTDHKPRPCPGCGRFYTGVASPSGAGLHICSRCGVDLPDWTPEDSF